jgi:multidrug efflux pump subunit AcrB
MGVAAIFLAGGFAALNLPLNRNPEISFPRVTVETAYPGMGAEDVRSIVTIPVEDALSPVKGLEGIRSVSRDNTSLLSLDFRWGVDANAASVLAREAIDAVYPTLPEGIEKPFVVTGASGEEPDAVIAVASRSGDSVFSRNFAEYTLRARLRRIDGVGRIVLAGGQTEEAVVTLDVQRALYRGIDSGALARMLNGETADIPAGSAREGERELVVVSAAKPASVEELARLVLASPSGPLYLEDVAEVRKRPSPLESLFIYNSAPQTALLVYRQNGADPVRLSRQIKKALDEIAPLYARDVNICFVYDGAPSIIAALKGLALSAGMGAAAVIVILLFFIGSLRYSLLAALSIPVSAAAAFVALALCGKSLNGMSLSGLALGIGLVSDTSVVILDALRSARAARPETVADTAAALQGSSFAGAATTAVVFIPIIFLPGALGALFGDMSIALVTSVISGWLYAQFLLPSFFYAVGKGACSGDGTRRRGAPKPRRLEAAYERILRRAVRHGAPVFTAALVLSGGGLAALLLLPARFVSPDAVSEVEVCFHFPAGTRLEAIAEDGSAAASVLQKIPCLETVFARAGAEGEDVGRRADMDYRKENLVFRCILKNGVNGADALAAIERAMKNSAPLYAHIDGDEIGVSFPQDKTEKLLGLSSAQVFAIRGNSTEETEARSAEAVRNIAEAAEKLSPEKPLAASCVLSPQGKRAEVRIRPKREAAAFLGVSAADMAQASAYITEGLIASRLEIEGKTLDVRVKGGGYSAQNDVLKKAAAIPLALSGRFPVLLGSVGDISLSEAPEALARLDRSDVRYLALTPAAGEGKRLAEALENARPHIEGFSRADESAFSRYRQSLELTVVLVIILLYLTLAIQAESFVLPLVFMLTIPFSLAGAGPALVLAGSSLDSSSALGLVVLFGIAVNNGIVLHEVSLAFLRGGLSPSEAVIRGARERLRSVLATTLTTVIALVPLAFSPLGAAQKSMSQAMLGGILASALLTLFVLPGVFRSIFVRAAADGKQDA